MGVVAKTSFAVAAGRGVGVSGSLTQAEKTIATTIEKTSNLTRAMLPGPRFPSVVRGVGEASFRMILGSQAARGIALHIAGVHVFSFYIGRTKLG